MTWTDDMIAASSTKTTTGGKDIKTLYKAIYLLNREPELVFQQFAQKQANTDMPLNKGDNIEYTRYAPLATSTTYNKLTEGATPSGEVYYAQTVTASLEEYGNFVQPSSRLWLTAYDPKLGGLSRLLGVQAGKSLDLNIQSVIAKGFMGMLADGDTTESGEVNCTGGAVALPTFTSLPGGITTTTDLGVIVFTSGKNEGITRTFAGASSTSLTVAALPHVPTSGDKARVCGTVNLATGDKITAALIKKAVALLEAQETPLFPDGYYHGVIPAGAMKYDFMNDTEYINLKHYAAPKDLYRNLVGEFCNVRFHKDTHPYKHIPGAIATYSVAATSTVQMVSIFGSDAFGNVKLAGKDQVFEVCPPEFTTTNPLAMYGTMSWKNVYAPLVLNGAWGVNIFAIPTVL